MKKLYAQFFIDGTLSPSTQMDLLDQYLDAFKRKFLSDMPEKTDVKLSIFLEENAARRPH